MTFLRRAALAATVGALCSSLGVAPLLGALTSPAADAAAVPCAQPSSSHRVVPDWRQRGDTPEVTAEDLAALPPRLTRPRHVAREVRPRLATHEQIRVAVHVISGTRPGERDRISRRQVVRVISILNRAMAGRQSSLSAATRYRFHLQHIDRTTREGWYHAYFNGPRDQRMKRHLHRGDARTLNLYVNGGGPAGEPVLGWSRFPWLYAAAPRLDGVSINAASLPGGKASGYDLGDTVVHETGHWLGLLPTFHVNKDTGLVEGPSLTPIGLAMRDTKSR